jgi:hypothetical protein
MGRSLKGRSRLVKLLMGLALSCGGPAAPPAAAACVAEAAALPTPADPRLQAAHLVVVHKSARRAQHFAGGAATRGPDGHPRCWPTALGFAPEGPKRAQGDGRTPEGWYWSSDKPWSSFSGAIAVHYPAGADGRAAGVAPALQARLDAAEAARRKPPQDSPLGGEILIHGGGAARDWTLGCVAMEDGQLDELRALLPADKGAWVLILP